MEKEIRLPATEKQAFETDKEYGLFIQFLEVGTINNLFNERIGQYKEKELYALAKKNKWKERKDFVQKDSYDFVKENKLCDLLKIKPKELENSIACSNKLDNMMSAVIAFLPSDMQSISKFVSDKPVKILHFVNCLNQFIKIHYFNKKIINQSIESFGIDLMNLTSLMDQINFGDRYENIESEFTEEELLEFKRKFEPQEQTPSNTIPEAVVIPTPTSEIQEEEELISPVFDLDAFMKNLRAEDDKEIRKRDREFDRKRKKAELELMS